MPPCASSKSPGLRRARVREGAAHVAEELVLDQRRRDRRAVHLDEGAAEARRLSGGARRHELLAGPALAPDQHRGVGARGRGDPLPRGPPSRRSGRRALLLRRAARSAPTSPSRAARESALRMEVRSRSRREGFLDEVEDAQSEGLDRLADRGLARDHDRRRERPSRPRLADEVDAARRRAGARRPAAGRRAGLPELGGAAASPPRRTPRPRARRPAAPPPGSARARGSSSTTITRGTTPPRAGAGGTSAPRAAGRARDRLRGPAGSSGEIARPRPIPSPGAAVVTYGSKSTSRTSAAMPGPSSATSRPRQAGRSGGDRAT